MKRFWFLLLGLCILLCSFSACDNSSDIQVNKDDNNTVASENPTDSKPTVGESGPGNDPIDVGSVYVFGSYEQDNNPENGAEPVEWIVLAKTDDSVLLISKYALDQQKFHETLEDITWENCTLRAWLNDTFLQNIFTEADQERVLETAVSAENNATFGTDAGNDTVDKIFLLSASEALGYFASDAERVCQPTEYAKANGAATSSEKKDLGNCWWGLRSPGDQYQSHIAYIAPSGQVYDGDGYETGFNVDSGVLAVRPALWVKIG